MNWYDNLVSEEFINYFCDENSEFYEICDDKVIYEPMFVKFTRTVMGLTYTHTIGPVGYRLSDYWNSIKTDGNSRYDVDVESLNANQIAVLIMYPFWSRMGGSFKKEFLDSGDLKKYLLALYNKTKSN